MVWIHGITLVWYSAWIAMMWNGRIVHHGVTDFAKQICVKRVSYTHILGS